MLTGAITEYVDVAQLALYAFWIFFAGLIFYLRREDRREGYPAVSEHASSSRRQQERFLLIPKPKTFLLPHGGTYQAPSGSPPDARELRARPTAPWPGAPLEPVGDPMLAGVGPGAWTEREDEPEFTIDGMPLIMPLRDGSDAAIDPRDPDPRGMEVVGADGVVAGTVKDLWVDRSEPQVRYFEVEVAASDGPRTVLLPQTLARVGRYGRQITVTTILARHFADVPRLKNPDRVTKREEDRISAYYAGGQMYATPARLGPVL